MKNWRSLYQERGVVQKEPSAKVVEAIDFFRTAKLRRVLDLGCGTGRHAAVLQMNGFQVYGCDSSASALGIAKRRLPRAHFQQCDMGLLPYRDECVDGVICHAVIQHGTVATIKKTITEIHRILRRGAILFLTVVSTDHPEYLTGQEIEPGTKINIEAIDGDMPHHYFTESEMRDFFRDFVILRLEHYTAPSEKNPSRMAATWALYASRERGF
jgi:SAM-dependent methyltransferase